MNQKFMGTDRGLPSMQNCEKYMSVVDKLPKSQYLSDSSSDGLRQSGQKDPHDVEGNLWQAQNANPSYTLENGGRAYTKWKLQTPSNEKIQDETMSSFSSRTPAITSVSLLGLHVTVISVTAPRCALIFLFFWEPGWLICVLSFCGSQLPASKRTGLPSILPLPRNLQARAIKSVMRDSHFSFLEQ